MRRIVLAAAAAAAAFLPATAAQAQACVNADKHPSQASVKELRSATRCLINAERTKRGLAPLRANGGLTVAGQRHARDMVRKRYFAHDSKSGTSFKTRILRAGYLRHHSGRAVMGENLAWGSDDRATPRSIVRAWMNSPGHRANILKSAYREVGIGVRRSSPNGLARSATYAAEFGRRY